MHLTTPPDSAKDLFLLHLATIERISMALCRRRGITGADAEDFTADVRARFVELDYEPLKRYRGEASLPTYLTVIVASWLKDHIVARDGRWRPTAAAVRLGPVAVQLERLMSKGGASADEAVAAVFTGNDQPYSEHELRALVGQLPRRDPLRPRTVTTEDALFVAAAPGTHAAHLIDAQQHDLDEKRANKALLTAMAELGPEDRLLVSMRFMYGHSVADIARTLRLDQKPLYRRLEQNLSRLRGSLVQLGLTGRDIQALVDGSEE
jgi:RNA polymerase sigma factor (sigma-70 family)